MQKTKVKEEVLKMKFEKVYDKYQKEEYQRKKRQNFKYLHLIYRAK